MTEQTYTVEDFRAAASLNPNEIPIGVIYKAIHIAELVMTPGVIKAGLLQVGGICPPTASSPSFATP